jgi:hypothetical protein
MQGHVAHLDTPLAGSLTLGGLRRGLFATLAVLALLGLVAEVLHHTVRPAAAEALIAMVSLSSEQNLPTWYASCLLLCCALVLGRIALEVRSRRGPFAAHWGGLCAAFLWISFDEVAEVHERLNGVLSLGGGVLYFSWVVPVGALLLVLGVLYVRFLWHLSGPVRRRFVVAGALYVGGALGMELPLGWWAEQAGEDSLPYVLLDWVEEVLELLGVTLFLLALLGYLGEWVRPPAASASPPTS